jgi:heme-degrading monooxygenase HmoA
MILRQWTTSIRVEAEDVSLAFARERSRAMFLSQPGCLGILFLRLPDGRHAACSLWRDAEAIRALGSSASYRETADALQRTGALVGEPEVTVCDVEGGAVDLEALARALTAAFR